MTTPRIDMVRVTTHLIDCHSRKKALQTPRGKPVSLPDFVQMIENIDSQLATPGIDLSSERVTLLGKGTSSYPDGRPRQVTSAAVREYQVARKTVDIAALSLRAPTASPGTATAAPASGPAAGSAATTPPAAGPSLATRCVPVACRAVAATVVSYALVGAILGVTFRYLTHTTPQEMVGQLRQDGRSIKNMAIGTAQSVGVLVTMAVRWGWSLWPFKPGKLITPPSFQAAAKAAAGLPALVIKAAPTIIAK